MSNSAAKSDSTSSVIIETEDCSDAKEKFINDINKVTNLISMNLERDNIDLSDASIGQPFLICKRKY